MSVSIKKVEIQIGKKTISLTMKQAKELQETLNEHFGEDVHHYHNSGYPYYPRPYPTWYASTTLASSDITANATATGLYQPDIGTGDFTEYLDDTLKLKVN